MEPSRALGLQLYADPQLQQEYLSSCGEMFVEQCLQMAIVQLTPQPNAKVLSAVGVKNNFAPVELKKKNHDRKQDRIKKNKRRLSE